MAVDVPEQRRVWQANYSGPNVTSRLFVSDHTDAGLVRRSSNTNRAATLVA
ncbi:MAG TPA: hypothetical protein VE570_10570 [Thermoleophilaceae bacterium]|nr:hypothetical protein [Thermoleophilaceae bacterium]